MNTPHVHAALIKAWADGAKIQMLAASGWWDIEKPDWDTNVVYRIKPEPKPDIVFARFISLASGGAADNSPVMWANYKNNVRLTFDGETKQLKGVALIV